MNNKEYQNLVNKITPKENILKNSFIVFISGGVLGVIFTLINNILLHYTNKDNAIIITLFIFISTSSILTGIGKYDDLTKKYKSALLIPITGFAHSVTSASLDYKKDGLITGIGANIFKLAGSVLLYGMISAFILTIIKVIING